MRSAVSNLARRHVFASFFLPAAMLWLAAKGPHHRAHVDTGTRNPHARPIHTFDHRGIFFVVAGLLTYAVIQCRAKVGDPPSEGAQI